MDVDLAAARLAELGHPTRLTVFRRLVQCGPNGCRVGDLQRALEIPASTLSHHLSRLVAAGLVEQRREGRVLRCLPVRQALDETLGFLTDECCAGSCDSAAPEMMLEDRKK
jgi:DNA-binding transcriptional ArsR family regulator